MTFSVIRCQVVGGIGGCCRYLKQHRHATPESGSIAHSYLRSPFNLPIENHLISLRTKRCTNVASFRHRLIGCEREPFRMAKVIDCGLGRTDMSVTSDVAAVRRSAKIKRYPFPEDEECTLPLDRSIDRSTCTCALTKDTYRVSRSNRGKLKRRDPFAECTSD